MTACGEGRAVPVPQGLCVTALRVPPWSAAHRSVGVMNGSRMCVERRDPAGICYRKGIVVRKAR